MPLLPLWAFVACYRASFTFTFIGHASALVEVTFDKSIPIIEFNIEEKIYVFLLKFPCFRLKEKKCANLVAHELAMHSVAFQ
jgi:hypothetical protein